VSDDGERAGDGIAAGVPTRLNLRRVRGYLRSREEGRPGHLRIARLHTLDAPCPVAAVIGVGGGSWVSEGVRLGKLRPGIPLVGCVGFRAESVPLVYRNRGRSERGACLVSVPMAYRVGMAPECGVEPLAGQAVARWHGGRCVAVRRAASHGVTSGVRTIGLVARESAHR
jgi:hypothetical protein